MIRDDAVHFCPVPPYAPFTAQATARSISASSMTARAFFDPISICMRVMLAIAPAAILRPVSTDPVKVMASIPALVTSASPILLPAPITKLNSPAGRSVSAMISANATAEAGTRLAGFHIIAFPKARAGAIFHTAVAVGKFQGLTTATTPTGSRRTSISISGRTESALSPIWRSTSAA